MVGCDKHFFYHGPLVNCPHCETDDLRAKLAKAEETVDRLRTTPCVTADRFILEENETLRAKVAELEKMAYGNTTKSQTEVE